MDAATLPAAAAWDYVRLRESGARTYADSVPRVLSRGSGMTVYDTEGREYLDFLSNAGTLALGHNHPYVAERVRTFLDSGQLHQALDITTPAKIAFLQTLFERLPGGLSTRAKVQFCGPTGADAAEAAIKLFKTATGRRTVLAFRGAYHGMSAGALSMTGHVAAKEPVAGLMPDVHFLPFPYSYRCPFGIGGAAGEAVGLSYIERLLGDPEGGITKPAAVIVEAIQGEGGVIPASRSWLRGLREITARFDIPLIQDEIQSGLGRSGQTFAFEDAGIEPDAILLSKAIGGGFPLSILVYDGKYDQWKPGAHAGTFRGNQIAMVAGVATMEFISTEGLAEQAQLLGKQVGEVLAGLAERYPEIGDVRGRGLMWGVEVVDPEGPLDSSGIPPTDGQRARAVKQHCMQNGLLLETGGRDGAVLRLLPPLIVSAADIDRMAALLEEALIACR